MFIDALGLFITLAGFVIGLGAVTVIDIHGFFFCSLPYWTLATIRTHKVTKPLIWIGIALVVIGGSVVYRDVAFVGLPLIHLALVLTLVLNGIFLSFVVSPFLLKREKEGRETELLPQSLQRKITLSFIVSFLGWWGSLALLVWYIVEGFF